MGILSEVFWASLMAGLPIGAFTMAIVWWALQNGHFSEALDTKALEREIKAMSKKRKKKLEEPKPELHPIQKKWAKFGGGFYGIVGFFTYIVIEVLEVISMIRNFGGILQFLKNFDFDVIVQIFISALTNFISALVWPMYWMRRIDTDQTWIWFVIAYVGYWCGLKLAQTLVQRKSRG